jgi:epoxyqueuosine reductase
MAERKRPEILFVPISTDANKIRFFGTLMPALLLLKASPARFAQAQAARQLTPRMSVEDLVASDADDVAQVEGMSIFCHRWASDSFDPLAFARAKTFLARVTRLARREGYGAEPLDPLSPSVNLPKLAARAGLGTLSPYGLLVHPAFGPRLILTGLRTDYPLRISSQPVGAGCTDCMACVRVCPQEPLATGVIRLGECQSCASCLAVCPVGKDAGNLADNTQIIVSGAPSALEDEG